MIPAKNRTWFAAFALFCGFALIYGATAQRGVSWQDSGEFQRRILAGEIKGIIGIAVSHPLYILLAKGFCFLKPSFFLMNLFSGICLAAADAFLFLLVFRLTRRMLCGVFAAVLFGLAHMPWWMGTIAEVYTLTAAFLALELLLVSVAVEKEKVWPWVFFVNGLGFANHNFALLSLPILFFACPRKRAVWPWFVGALPVLALIPGEWTELGFVKTVTSVLFGYQWSDRVLSTGGWNWTLVLMNYAIFAVSLLNPAWRFAVRPLVAERGSFIRILRWITAIHAVFFLRYFVPDQATFAIPTLLLLAVWAGLGLKEVPTSSAVRILCVSAACAVLVPQAVLKYAEGRIHRARNLPYREEARYWLLPWKQNENSAQRFIDELKLPEGALLFSDTTSAGTLAATDAPQRKWKHLDPWTERSEPSADSVYVVSPVRGYAPEWLFSGRWKWEKDGVVYRCERVKP